MHPKATTPLLLQDPHGSTSISDEEMICQLTAGMMQYENDTVDQHVNDESSEFCILMRKNTELDMSASPKRPSSALSSPIKKGSISPFRSSTLNSPSRDLFATSPNTRKVLLRTETHLDLAHVSPRSHCAKSLFTMDKVGTSPQRGSLQTLLRTSTQLDFNIVPRRTSLSPSKMTIMRQDTNPDLVPIIEEKPSNPAHCRLLSLSPNLPDIEVGNSVITCGRKKSCTIRITNSGFISSVHCKIFSDHNVITVEDTSKNGTFVNGEKIGEGQRRTLCDGDILSLVAPATTQNLKRKGQVVAYMFESNRNLSRQRTQELLTRSPQCKRQKTQPTLDVQIQNTNKMVAS